MKIVLPCLRREAYSSRMASGWRKHAKFLPGGSLTYSEVLSDYTTVLTLTQDCGLVFILNSLNADVWVSLPNEDGSGEFVLPARTSQSFDVISNAMQIAAGAIRVKYVSAPTSGRISVLGVA